jgi:hypothetical protein
METKHRTEITIETHETTIIRVSMRQTVNAFCEICRTTHKHFSVRRAAAILRLSETAIFRLVEDGQVHSTENAAGALFVCINSLSAVIEGSGIKDEG